MKLHSDIHTVDTINDALSRAKDSGKVDRLVQFEIFDEKGSRTRKNAFEIKLGWYGEKVKGDGRRWTNTGTRGSDSLSNGQGNYAATYDEWGWFIAELFDKDADAVFGNYKGRDDFDSQTRWKFSL
jgi:hypothetical protein